jgi:hypothetical protein
MNKDNKKTKFNDIDKKLHISVVISCYIPTKEYLIKNIEKLNSSLDKLYTL